MTSNRILVVEDDVDLRNIYDIVLKRAGYEVCLTGNGQEALDEIKECAPQLVLLDVFMPVMDGKTFLKKLDLTKYPGLKIVVCSNTSDSDLMSEMKSLGADKVVTKSTLSPQGIADLVAPYMA